MKRKRRFSERLLAILLALVLAVPMLMEPAAVSMGAEMGGVDVQNLDTGNGDPAEGGDGTGTTPTPTTTVTPSTSPETTPEVTPEPKYTLSGTVTCGGEPVSGATVTETITGQSATSGADGSYVIDGIPAGTYQLQVEKNGFATQTVSDITVAGDLSVGDINLPLAAPTYTVSGKYEVDQQLTFQVSNPADEITYNWSFEGDVFTPNATIGELITGTLVKSGNLIVNLTASYGSANLPGSGDGSRNVSTRTPAVSLQITPASDQAEAGITSLIITATVDGVGDEGSVTFTEENRQGTFTEAIKNVEDGKAEATYKAESSEGFGGELSFTAAYSGVTNKYEPNSASISGTYNSARPVDWLEKDCYGNNLAEQSQTEKSVQIEYGSVYEGTAPGKGSNYQIPVDTEKFGGTYTYQVVNAENNPVKEDAPYSVDSNGVVTFNRATREGEQIYVQVTRSTPGYADAVARIQITVTPRIINLDTEKTTFTASKIYDATVDAKSVQFALSGDAVFERNDGKTAVLPGEQIALGSNALSQSTEAVDAGFYETQTAGNAQISLTGAQAANYTLVIRITRFRQITPLDSGNIMFGSMAVSGNTEQKNI